MRHFPSAFQPAPCTAVSADDNPRRHRFSTARVLILLAGIGAALFPSTANAEPITKTKPVSPARVYQTTRLTGPAPIIDGHLDDACWKNLGEWTSDFTQREPHEGARGSQPTQLKVLYDDHYVYVAIRAYEPNVASQPRILGARDEFTGDMVGINFDSYHDRRSGFEFDVTSGGSKIDLILHNDGTVDMSWNAIWDVKTGVEADAWTAEFRIPLSQLRYQQGCEQVWGMHCWRWINALQEESDWNLIPMDHHGMIYSFGEIHGIRDLPSPRRLEFSPYVIALAHRYAPEPGNPFRPGHDSALRGGLDAKYGLSTNLTVDLTLNPDFSQVDADPSEINLTTVETFLTERRPFFVEGAEIFDFKLDDDLVFYTRRIGNAPSLAPPDGSLHESPENNRILGAAKLTGRTSSGLTVGVLHAVVDRTTARVLDSAGNRRVTIEPPSNSTVVRLQQDFDEGNTRAGAIFSSRLRTGTDAELQTLPRRSFTFGADVEHYFENRTYLLEGRILGSEIQGSPAAIEALADNPVHNFQRPDADYLALDHDADRLSGHAGFLRGGRAAGTWRYNGFVSWRSPGVDFNDLGYMQVADFIAPGVQVQYYDASAGTLFRRRDLRLKYLELQDFGGERLGRRMWWESEFATLSGAYLSARVGAETDTLDPHILRGGPALRLANSYPASFYMETDGGKPFQYRLEGSFSATAESHSHAWHLAPGLVWKLGDRIKTSLSVGYDHNLEATQYAGTSPGLTDPVYVMGRLDQRTISSTLKLNVIFTPALSLSYYGGPFATVGRYNDFKAVVQPRAASPQERYASLSLHAAEDGSLQGDFLGAPLRMNHPDFNWREFKSNLVLRWEYRTGSYIYCVWSQYRSDAADIGGFAPVSQYERLFSAHPDNTFLVKLSYWFTI